MYKNNTHCSSCFWSSFGTYKRREENHKLNSQHSPHVILLLAHCVGRNETHLWLLWVLLIVHRPLFLPQPLDSKSSRCQEVKTTSMLHPTKNKNPTRTCGAKQKRQGRPDKKEKGTMRTKELLNVNHRCCGESVCGMYFVFLFGTS